MEAREVARSVDEERFEIDVRAGASRTSLRLRGELDFAAVPRLAAALAWASCTGKPVEIELDEVVFGDGVGASLIVHAGHLLATRGREISVRGAPAERAGAGARVARGDHPAARANGAAGPGALR